ncbi:BMC domain-containing protein [Limosilactobacillus sp. STM2_1]|uniref:BMC domain-containing protein n=1 Tax=Limosilactobacillus rudii TaxID=2759755 RepID=A0A7W3YNL6_9LACO|nr:BMC domain-containing protein [Limosilactobacillus rudii]MBB1079396.1 BMC domain-containing protein [Limosilactobacillus rudii]MBB1097442.1 BMC domain-containing protein [Limosilactobacillus rudii]MCD7134551.1 BMC domain-containing protein [Limosilactobacillus rudii]
MKSLGYVECNGLSGAIVAADRMLKTADVDLSSIQNTKGNGWVTLQVSGELSAVTVAVEAVKDYLPDVYVTSTVIGRPASGLSSLGKTDLLSQNSAEKEPAKPAEKTVVIEPKPVENSIDEKVDKQTDETSSQNIKPLSDNSQKVDDSDKEQQNVSSNEKVTCNMCGDPKCPRKLGEPHKKCIHYNELKKK